MTDTLPPIPSSSGDLVPLEKLPRKRGGQSGNSNALKHGVYSRHYTPEELLALDRDVAGSLKDELEILRLSIFDAANSVLAEPEDSLSFHDHVSAMNTVAVAVSRLENVIQVRMTAFGDPDRREQQVESMLALMEQSEMPGSHGLSPPSPNVSHLGRVGVGQGAGEYISPQGEAASSRHRQPPRLRSIPKGQASQGVPPPSRKKRGAPPGNSNAYKHGFYASAFTSSEKKLLQGDGADQLRHEETLLRILIRRTWRSFRAVRSTLPWQEVHFTVRSVGYAVFVIAKLQRARRRFFGDMTDLEKDIKLGLSEACADLGILDYFHSQVNK